MLGKARTAIKNPGAIPPYIDDRLSHDFFNIPNPGGMEAICRGKMNRLKCKYLSDYATASPISSDIETLRNQHYLDLGHPFRKTLIKSIRDHYNQIITDDRYIQEFTGNRSPPAEYEDEVFIRRIWGYGNNGKAEVDFFSEFPGITNVVQEVSNLIRGYYDAYFNVGKITAYRTYHIR